jgi:hypothetical protein
MIGKGFSECPKLSEPFPSNRRYWKCPKTGLVVPKWHGEHLEWREKLLRKAENDPVLQKDLLAACKESLLFWINGFVWTKHEFETDPVTGKQTPAKQTHWPFNTWDIQDLAFNWLEDRFNLGEDGLIHKSREMGASWKCVAFIHWLWLFRPDTEAREMSRVEQLVDSPIAKSLFYKHDYINLWTSDWMRPPGVLQRGKDNRTKLRIYNELNQSTIAGEATGQHAMRADRCAILLLDEFAAVDNGQEIRTSTTAVTPCRIVNSTSIGAGTEYARWKKERKIKIFTLMFWDHPQKGNGRFVLQDPITKTYHISSPWFERLKERCTDRELAQEQLGEDLEAGDVFFTLSLIDTHKALFARLPKSSWNIKLKDKIPNAEIINILRRRDIKSYDIRKVKEGKLDVWIELISGRPDQSKTYIFGIDTSKGQGATESVVSIKCKQTGEIIAKWKCKNTPPYEFARVLIALALWCGGSNPQRLPFLKWENNGPGWDLGRLLVHEFRYPYYYKSETIGKVGVKKTDKYGYHMSRESKELLLRAYERALKQGTITNHDEQSLEQAKYYIYYNDGGIGPAELTDKKAAEKLLHGDRVIADALTVEDKEVAKPKFKGPTAPYRSFEWRFNKFKKSKQKSKGWRRKFSFV